MNGRLVKEGGIQMCNMSTEISKWVKSWAENPSMLVDTVAALVPLTNWIGWRTANLHSFPPPNCWSDMIMEMNAAAKKYSTNKGRHFVDYSHTPGIMDNM